MPPFVDGLFYKADGLSPFAMYGNKVLTSLNELQVNKDGNVISSNANTPSGSLGQKITINSKGFVVVKDHMVLPKNCRYFM